MSVGVFPSLASSMRVALPGAYFCFQLFRLPGYAKARMGAKLNELEGLEILSEYDIIFFLFFFFFYPQQSKY